MRRALEVDTGALEVYDLAFEAGVAMETLAELVAAPLFYQRCVFMPQRAPGRRLRFCCYMRCIAPCVVRYVNAATLSSSMCLTSRCSLLARSSVFLNADRCRLQDWLP